MALLFNGSSDKLLDATGSVLSGTPGTICAWARVDGLGNERNIAECSYTGAGNNVLYRIYMDASGKPHAQLRNDVGSAGQDFANASGTTTFSTTAFQHICGTFQDGGSASVKVYYNGTEEAEDTTMTNSTAITLDQTAIGVLQRDSAAQFWDGDIAEVGMWNVLLTQPEIASLAAGMSPLLVRPASLVMCAPLIRNVIDVTGGATYTTTGTAVATHPRIIRPFAQLAVSKPGPRIISVSTDDVVPYDEDPWIITGAGFGVR